MNPNEDADAWGGMENNVRVYYIEHFFPRRLASNNAYPGYITSQVVRLVRNKISAPPPWHV